LSTPSLLAALARRKKFGSRTIRKNEAFFQEAVSLGASMTPVTLIEKEDGEKIVVHGFDKEELSRNLSL